MDITIYDLNSKVLARATTNLLASHHVTSENIEQSIKTGELGRRLNELKHLKKVAGPPSTSVASKITLAKGPTVPDRTKSGAVVVNQNQITDYDDDDEFDLDEYYDEEGINRVNTAGRTEGGTVVVTQQDGSRDKEVTDKILENMKQAQKASIKKTKNDVIVVSE